MARVAAWRLRRWAYAAAMLAVFVVTGAATAWLGIEYGLRHVLPAFAVVAGLALVLRLLLSAARWRDAGLPGLPLALATTAALVALFAMLPPSVALIVAAAILLAEVVLPSRR